MSKRKSAQQRKERNNKIKNALIWAFIFVAGLVLGGKAYMYHRAYCCSINNQNSTYVGYCENFEVVRTNLRHGEKVTYYFYLDNGIVLSTPQFILERAEINMLELDILFADRLKFTYCPYSTMEGVHWIASISKGNVLILPESITQSDFAYGTKVYGISSGLVICPAVLIIVVSRVIAFHHFLKRRRKTKMREKRKQLRDNQRPT